MVIQGVFLRLPFILHIKCIVKGEGFYEKKTTFPVVGIINAGDDGMR